MSEPETTAPNSDAPITLEAWEQAAYHRVRLPSGTSVKIKLPDLPELIKAGQIPNPLVKVAVGFAAGGNLNVTEDLVKELPDFYRFVASVTCVEPKLTPEQVEKLPVEDVEMLMEFATRQRDVDAVGHYLGGLETVESFRRFRGLGPIDEGVAGQ